jgi:hypothetical protein
VQDEFQKYSQVHTKCRVWLPLASTFLEQYDKDGDEFLNHIVRATSKEMWVPFVNVETKERSKQWMHTFTKQTEKFKKMSACQKADGSCFL